MDDRAFASARNQRRSGFERDKAVADRLRTADSTALSLPEEA
jgi:hypothetical protein